MSIEALKEQARRHEQKEEWQKALDQYQKAIEKLAEDDQPDIGLYNRVGDLSVRVGNLDGAVTHYETAVDLYVEAYLPNNAIAICKKVIRNLPDRHSIYLKMGQIRAEQGFLPDARTYFLTYAERMQQAGDLDESFRALVEFCDLAPDDVDVRLAVADQMASHEHAEDAVEQLSIAYQALMSSGDADRASTVEARIRELNPDAVIEAAAVAEPEDMVLAGSSLADDGEITADFGEIHIGDEEEVDAAAEAVEEAVEEEASDFDLSLGGDEEDSEEAAELPMMSFDDEGDDEGAEVPTIDVDSGDALESTDEDAGKLPLMSFDDKGEDSDDDSGALDAAAFGEADHGERETQDYVTEGEEMEEVDLGLSDISSEADEAVEEAVEEAAADAGAAEPEETMESVQAAIETLPDDVKLQQRNVELAYQVGDDELLSQAYLSLAGALDRTGESTRAVTAYRQVLDLDPENAEAQAALGDRAPQAQPVKEVASHEEYVDLGSMLLGDDTEKSTRMTVAYEEPSGDEEADFAKMLSQFKEKVSENIDADDVRAHHDLGTAYKEMGLLDEAIAEFQQALRASPDHLPTFEVMGQTFMEMGQSAAAVRSLERALEVEYDVEDELLGIYYYLARAYEDMGTTDSAVEFYDRVFALDINFADVTERLRALR